jgi:DNA mismatch endonuclease, patch repair protein
MDNLTLQQRSYCMSRVRSKDTGLEKSIRSELHKQGLRFRKHPKNLPGKPDIVFLRANLVVFIDGDFWHGYRFPAWKEDVSDFWKRKIGENRERDKKNFAKLRNMGWRVIRIWQHEIQRDHQSCIDRIVSAVNI